MVDFGLRVSWLPCQTFLRLHECTVVQNVSTQPSFPLSSLKIKYNVYKIHIIQILCIDATCFGIVLCVSVCVYTYCHRKQAVSWRFVLQAGAQIIIGKKCTSVSKISWEITQENILVKGSAFCNRYNDIGIWKIGRELCLQQSWVVTVVLISCRRMPSCGMITCS